MRKAICQPTDNIRKYVTSQWKLDEAVANDDCVKIKVEGGEVS